MTPNERLTTILQMQEGMDPRRVIAHRTAHIIQHHGAIGVVARDAEAGGARYREPLLSLPCRGNYSVALVPTGNTVEMRHVRRGFLLAMILDGSRSAGPDAWDLPDLISKVQRVVVAASPHIEAQFTFLAGRLDSGGNLMVIEAEPRNYAEWCRAVHSIAPTKAFSVDSSGYPQLTPISLSNIAA